MQKEELLIEITFDPCKFSLDSPFKQIYIFNFILENCLQLSESPFLYKEHAALQWGLSLWNDDKKCCLWILASHFPPAPFPSPPLRHTLNALSDVLAPDWTARWVTCSCPPWCLWGPGKGSESRADLIGRQGVLHVHARLDVSGGQVRACGPGY
jgi:hypothetical protein